MSNDTAGHPRIDFAWGNMPMQPNTERGIHPLDPVLDSHEIAYLGWNGFPDYVPNTTHTNSGSGSGSGGSGAGPNLVTVPNFVGLNYATQNVYNLISASGLSIGVVTENPTTDTNAISLVTDQSLTAGNQVPVGTVINLQRNQDFATPSGYVLTSTMGANLGFQTQNLPSNKIYVSYNATAGNITSEPIYSAAANEGLVGHTIAFAGLVSVDNQALADALNGLTGTVTASTSQSSYGGSVTLQVTPSASVPSGMISSTSAGTATVSQ